MEVRSGIAGELGGEGVAAFSGEVVRVEVGEGPEMHVEETGEREDGVAGAIAAVVAAPMALGGGRLGGPEAGEIGAAVGAERGVFDRRAEGVEAADVERDGLPHEAAFADAVAAGGVLRVAGEAEGVAGFVEENRLLECGGVDEFEAGGSAVDVDGTRERVVCEVGILGAWDEAEMTAAEKQDVDESGVVVGRAGEMGKRERFDTAAGGLGAWNGRVDAQLDARRFVDVRGEECAQRGEFGGGGFAAGDGIDFNEEARLGRRSVGEAVIFPAVGRAWLIGGGLRGAAGEEEDDQREGDEGGRAEREAVG